MPRFSAAVLVSMLVCALFFIGSVVIHPAPAFADGTKLAPKGVDKMIPLAKQALKKGRIGTTRIGGEQAVLAAWKQGTKTIRLINVRDGRSVTKGFEVKLIGKPNGANTRYEVVRPDGWHVLAIRTNVRRDLHAKHSMPVIYVPYDDHVDVPKFREAGRKYLDALVSEASAALNSLDVRSKTDARARVTAVVPRRVLITLLVIEHIDPADFTARGVTATARRVLSTIGVNKGDAYDYSVSHMSAGGLAQFIPGTYADIRAEYPEAKLTKDFLVGMRDHRNAVMIQYCFIDFALSKLSSDAFNRLARDERELGAYLAAAYNHGQNGAAKVYAEHGDDWDKPGNGIGNGSLLYVKEFRAVYRYLWEN